MINDQENNINNEQDNVKQDNNVQVDNCKIELDSIKNQLLRVNADFDNFKKRVSKERSEWEDLARFAVIEDILPIFDDFERAVELSKSSVDEKNKSWIDGFEIIYKNFKKMLDALNVKEVDCSGDFNPEFHEALMQVESESHKTGEIVLVLNKGYALNGKVIRHARVSVAK
ncbi:nucleotide exchange factor GrpE [Candidatus Dependentiae bacterium]|nr:nucleotide exchange factor GrpE [Candidatus Dependentiae bacterium]MBU4387038.1 nucleotide exchange factor GrpE [Candidatus Dependentiae bacterium]MCG2756694.1 nucleotide exchange factor GrpE [Candidatus Dependentiae bacterium]